MTSGSPVYLDWGFWAALVAAAALVLSQMPPLYQMLRPGRLRVEAYSRVAVTHKVGNPIIQLHLILANTGGRGLRIDGMSLRLVRDGKEVATLVALNYLQQPNDQNTVILTRFSVKAKEEWAHIINFLTPFSRAQEKAYRDAERVLKADIFAKKALPDGKDRVVVAEPQNVNALETMFDGLFIWQAGEYEATLTVRSSNGREVGRARYRFTLFESDSQELSGAKADFKIGDGIYWNSSNHSSVLVQLIEA